MGTDGFTDHAAFYGKNLHRKFGIFCDVSFDAVIYNFNLMRKDGYNENRIFKWSWNYRPECY